MADESPEQQKAKKARADARAAEAEMYEWHKKQRKAMENMDEAEKNRLKSSLDYVEALAELNDKLEETARLQNKANEALQLAQEQGRATAKGLGALIGLNESYETSMLGSVSATLKGGEANTKFREQMKKTFTVQNAAYSILLKITQATTKLMFAQDEALVSFNKTTGASAMYGGELIALEDRLSHHGITMDIANDSMASMVKNIKGLNKMSKVQKNDIADTTALLDKFGVAADTTTSNIHFMTRSLGMSVKQSAKFQREIFALAQDVGMPPAEMADQFKSAGPKLAAFGKLAGKTFKKLSLAARNAGMEVEQLLTITEQFDTFEGAAEAVGKLNALLGGPFLNSMEMVMETDPTERMKKLSQGLRNAGKSFDQMSYYERKAIASAAGLADTNELALVMAGNFEGMAGDANLSSAEIQKLAEQSKEFNTMMDELTQTMREFAVSMKPAIDWVKRALEAFQDLSPETKRIIGWSTLLILAIKTLSDVLSPFGNIISAVAGVFSRLFTPAITTAADATEKGSKSIGKAIENVAKSAAKGSQGLLTLSVVALALGGAIAIAAYGVSFLLEQFVKMDADKIWYSAVAIAALGASLTAMLYVVGIAVGSGVGALAIVAIMAIGASFAIAAIGASVLVSEFTNLFKVLTPAAILSIVTSLGSLIFTMNSMPLAAPALAIMTLSIGAFAAAMALIDTSKLAALEKLFNSLSKLTSENADNVATMSSSVAKMVTAAAILSLNPLAVAAMVSLGASGAATTAATQPTYSSTKDGLESTPGGASQTSASQALSSRKIEVSITMDPLFKRYFNAEVLDVVGGRQSPMNAVTKT
jgi:hypothetical protein